MLKRYFAIQAIGRDKPGLVAIITEVVCERFGCNVETAHMTILGGHFASTLIASTPEELDEEDLEKAFREVDSDSGVRGFYVSSLGENDFKQAWRGASHEVTVHAPEQPGVVHLASKTLAEQEVNITSLASDCAPDGTRCTVVLQVVLPGTIESAHLKGVLERSLPSGTVVDVKPARREVI
jgi:glycine cleavage system regulatory protein